MGLVGLYGYIWCKRIGLPLIWKILLIFEMTVLVVISYNFSTNPEFLSEFSGLELFVMCGVIIFLMVPYWYGLFQYGFRAHDVWR